MSSAASLRGDCDSIRNNLRTYLEKWWHAKNETDYLRYGKKAEQTYIRLSFDCQGATDTYTKMLAEVQKLPKGVYLREIDAKEKAGKGPHVMLKREQAPGPPGQSAPPAKRDKISPNT